MIHRAFDLGITHFDLANNYGPPPGSAEEKFGRILTDDLKRYRDELVISSKAGYFMWPGPYGEWGSRKYLVASLDQSLKRMGLDYVDIFYSHRRTPTRRWRRPWARSISSCAVAAPSMGNFHLQPGTNPPGRGHPAQLGTPCLIHQPALQHVRPLDRGGPAERAGRGGHRLHRLLAAGPGHPDRQIPAGHPGGLAPIS